MCPVQPAGKFARHFSCTCVLTLTHQVMTAVEFSPCDVTWVLGKFQTLECVLAFGLSDEEGSADSSVRFPKQNEASYKTARMVFVLTALLIPVSRTARLQYACFRYLPERKKWSFMLLQVLERAFQNSCFLLTGGLFGSLAGGTFGCGWLFAQYPVACSQPCLLPHILSSHYRPLCTWARQVSIGLPFW